LNDLAYKAVRKRGNQKKLDERAIKNDAFYKKINKQIKDTVKDFDMETIRKTHEALAEVVGSCPLSCNDLFEALEGGDCMCIGLDVERSEACIADPSRLVIKDIVPTFMTADSFLDSAVFSLRKDSEAHGGFTGAASKDDHKAQLAMGMGREAITGVMPLYLFKEHWDIARRKSPPIYGFLCTLDIMGYASGQYFTVPYLVLLKAIEKAKQDATERNIRICELVAQTCRVIMQGNEEFRKQTIKMLSDFHNQAECRTADIVASIPVLIAQLYTLLSCEKFEEYLPAVENAIAFTREQLQVIMRFAMEEQMRRAIKHDADPINKSQLLKLLCPEYVAFCQEIMDRRAVEIKAEFKKSEHLDEGTTMHMYAEQAKLFRSMDPKGRAGAIEEQKKPAMVIAGAGDASTAASSVDVYGEAEAFVARMPWIRTLEEQKSDLSTMISLATRMFIGKQKVLLMIANMLKIADTEISSFLEMPIINGQREILTALVLQNLLHPKNHQRTEAIKSHSYVAIANLE
jgi:hypothetical protein